jgi:ribosome-binding factor A
MADPARARRLAVRIRQIVSATIEMQIKDPRLGMVTITDARVTSDLREATVFYTVYGDETEIADSARALTSATGVLRSTVGKQTGIKFVPTLTFVADIVPDTARELELALERVRHADAELARAREGAQYAGEPDPYRRPAEDDDLEDDDLEDDALPDDDPSVAPAAVLERDDIDRDVLSRDELTASPLAQPSGVPHD